MTLLSGVNSLKYVLTKTRECKTREVIINNEYMTYPYSIKVNRCNGNCNNINNPYARVCVPNIIKDITLNIFDLISWKNKTKQIKWHESCRCVCRLDPIVCNNKQKWNKDKCRCECLVNKKCDNKFFWNPSKCKCECKKKAAHLLTEECEEIIDNNKTLSAKENENVSIKKYNKTVSIKENTSLDSCKPYSASSVLFLLVSVIITGAFIYFYVNSQSKKITRLSLKKEVRRTIRYVKH